MTTRSKAWVCDCLLDGTAVPNSVGGRRILRLLCVVWCQVVVSASGWSLVQSNPTDCGVSDCDREVWIMGRPWPTGGCRAMGEQLGIKI